MELGALYNAVLTLPSGKKQNYTGLTHIGLEYESDAEINLLAFRQRNKSEPLFIDPAFISSWEFTEIGYASNVWHVWSGVDAFIIRNGKSEIYMPYIAVIASTAEKAREKAAAILGQSLEDQDTNDSYGNYIDFAEFKYVHSS